jgi:hypothetical protein
MMDALNPSRGTGKKSGGTHKAHTADRISQQADSLTEEQVSEFKEAFSLFVSLLNS